MLAQLSQDMKCHLSSLPWRQWLSKKRWFVRTELGREPFLETVVLTGNCVVCFVKQGDDLYFVPLIMGKEGAKDAMVDSDGHPWIDALEDPEGVRELLDLCMETAQGPKWAKIGGRLFDRPALDRSRRGEVRIGTADQTNSWAMVGDSFLKVYRLVDFCGSLDVEVLEALDGRPDVSVPKLRAILELGTRDSVAALMVVQEAIPHECNAWDAACAEVFRAVSGEVVDPAPWKLLGRRVAELHGVMAEAFGIEFLRKTGCERFGANATELAADVLGELSRKSREGWSSEIVRQVDLLLSRGEALSALFASAAPTGLLTQRVHGDLHLGQILSREGDWTIIDFEGEPARPAHERAAKAHAAKDVSGMLRSFDYASRAGLPEGASEAAVARAIAWRDAARRAFLDGYFAHPPVDFLWPSDPAARERLLSFHEAEKAVYELRYEMRHRPDWMPIPLGGLLALLGPRETTA